VGNPVKFVVIVCGVTHPDGIDFNKMADAHARQLVPFYASHVDDKTPIVAQKTVIRFLHFDVTQGKVHVAEQLITRAKTPKFKWSDLDAFTSSEGTTAENPKEFVTLPSNVRPVHFKKKKTSDPDSDFGTGDQKHVFQQTDEHGAARDVSGVMSIVDVYRSIRGAPQHSVLELVFFTHGFSGGPVLVNSFEDHPLPSDFSAGFPKRSASDKDARLRTDLHTNMGEDPNEVSSSDKKKHGGDKALEQFKNAFDSKAVIRTCGCEVQDAVSGDLVRSTSFQVIREAYVLAPKDLRKKLLSKGTDAIKPDDEITLDMEREFLAEHNHDTDTAHTVDKLRDLHIAVDPTDFFKGYDKTIAFKKKWGDILKFLARQNLATYQVELANTLGVTVFAAPHGTSSQNEQGASNNTMRVCRLTKEPGCTTFKLDKTTKKPVIADSESYAPYLDFYERFFHFNLTDPLDKLSGTFHNYVAFDGDALTKLATIRDTGQLPPP
jgi:hypothetical protein